jgi:hypothetical protein
MRRIEQARALVRGADLTAVQEAFADEDDLCYYDGRFTWLGDGPLTADLLASTLHLLVDLEVEAVKREEEIPLGATKYRGLPHLPAGTAWPARCYFAAQLNLAELAALGVETPLPTEGMLYLFFNGGGDCQVIHYTGPMDALEVTPYPDAATLPHARYYLREFAGSPQRATLKPGAIFYFGGDAFQYKEITQALPDALKAQVEALLGCPITDSDFGVKLFGRPHYWQGEDERDLDEGGEDGEPDLLLFEDELGDASIHFWIDAAALAAGDFSGVWVTGSGT